MSCTKNSVGGSAEKFPGGNSNSLQKVIAVYREKNYAMLERELETFRDFYLERNDLRELIRVASWGINPENGKRLSHERALRKSALAQWEKKLLLLESAIAQCGDFEQLYELLDKEAKTVKHIGALVCYDTALRIGSALNILPRNYVYLHAGAQLPNEKKNRDRIETAALKDVLANTLPSFHIENFLCIYQEDLLPLGSVLKKNNRHNG